MYKLQLDKQMLFCNKFGHNKAGDDALRGRQQRYLE
jgi:hypothetical protein